MAGAAAAMAGGGRRGAGDGADGSGMADERPTASRQGCDRRRELRRPSEPAGRSAGVEPTVRKNFADTAFWIASLTTDKDGIAEVDLRPCRRTSPAGRSRSGRMGHGTKVGQGEAEVVTKKDLIVRLQAPRFFVQKDEVVLSANVHNYLKTDKNVDASRSNSTAARSRPIGDAATQKVKIAAGGEQRVDWRVKVVSEGEAIVRMKALTDEESDAMEMKFPVYVHGMLKTGIVLRRHPARQGLGKVDAQRPGRAAHQRDAARSPLLADAGRGDGRRPALPGRLSLRLHRADAQPLPADRHHAATSCSG